MGAGSLAALLERRPLWILFSFLFLYLCIILVSPPPFSGTDTFWFKAPGVQFSLGHGLASRSQPDQITPIPETFGTYPPLYPVVYGLYCKLAGIGPRQNAIFDLLVSGFSAILGWIALSPLLAVADRRMRFAVLLLIALSLPKSLFFADLERPDSFAMLLALSAWLLSGSGHRWRRILGGVFAGLVIVVSPYGFLIALYLLVLRLLTGKSGPIRLDLTIGWLGAIVLSLGVTALILPESLESVLGHASGGSGSGLYFAKQALFHGPGVYLRAISHYSSPGHGIQAGAMVLGVVAGVIVASNIEGKNRWWMLAMILVPALGTFLLFPYQTNYMAMLSVALLVMILHFSTTSNTPAWNGTPTLVLLVLLWSCGFGFIHGVRSGLITWGARNSYVVMHQQLRKARAEFPEGKRPLASCQPYLYFLVRDAGYAPVYPTDEISPALKERGIDLVVASFRDAREVEKAVPLWATSVKRDTLFTPDAANPPRVLGVRVGNLSKSWWGMLLKTRP